MKSILIFISLLALILCTSRVENPGVVADIYKGVKGKIYKCVSGTEGISKALKDLTTKNLQVNEDAPLNFHTIPLTKEDRIAIKDCKREAFRNSNTK